MPISRMHSAVTSNGSLNNNIPLVSAEVRLTVIGE